MLISTAIFNAEQKLGSTTVKSWSADKFSGETNQITESLLSPPFNV